MNIPEDIIIKLPFTTIALQSNTTLSSKLHTFSFCYNSLFYYFIVFCPDLPSHPKSLLYSTGKIFLLLLSDQ
jgi:hypothetical protein